MLHNIYNYIITLNLFLCNNIIIGLPNQMKNVSDETLETNQLKQKGNGSNLKLH